MSAHTDTLGPSALKPCPCRPCQPAELCCPPASERLQRVGPGIGFAFVWPCCASCVCRCRYRNLAAMALKLATGIPRSRLPWPCVL